jgi:DNA (cytosine-5)-methyltransferase 1
MMKYFSLFSGIGGFEKGFPESWQCVGYSEIDKWAMAIYRRHFPDHQNYGDATGIPPTELPIFDLLCAGFPCQPFSTAGNRNGLADCRGTLFFQIVRILRDKRPRYFLLENVKGLLSNDDGQTFHVILRALAQNGYLVQWEMLNSKHFGVPQHRERVFFIGHLRGQPRPEIFPIGESGQTLDAEKPAVYPVDANYSKGAARCSRTMIGVLNPKAAQNFRVHTTDGVSPTINANMGGGAPCLIHQIPRGGNKGKSFNIAPTITSNNYANNNFLDNAQGIRRLTPLEVERLQGFPDGYTQFGVNAEGEQITISDTQRYKTLGNAVTVNVVKEIARRF